MERVQSLAHDLIEAGNEHFRIATQPGRVLFWMADTTGSCELVSGSWQQFTGQDVDDALGQGWLDVVVPDDRTMLRLALQVGIKAQKGFHLNYRILKRDGTSCHILHDACARFLPSGKFNGLVGTITDQTDGNDGARALERASQQVYDFLDDSPLAALAMGFDGSILHCNPVISKLCDPNLDDLTGQDWVNTYISPLWRGQVQSLINGLISPSVLPAEMEYQIETAEGERLFRWHLTLIRDFDGTPVSIAMLGTDITQWREIGNHSRLTAQMFASCNEAMVITDRTNCIVSVNDAFTMLTGYRREEAIGNNPRILQSGNHDREFYQAMWSSISNKGFWRGDIWDRRKDGSCYPKYLTISEIRDETGKVTNYSAIFYDATERKAMEDRLDHLAHYDSLTNLPNRTLLQDRLEQTIAISERKKQKFALLFIDLDGFKRINDEAGHPVGDEVLKIVAQRLLAVIRGMDTAARLGGDEFVIVLTDIMNKENAARVAEKVIESLSVPYCIANLSLQLSASVGVSIYPNDRQDPIELLRTADEAMYEAKRGGKRQVKFYNNIS